MKTPFNVFANFGRIVFQEALAGCFFNVNKARVLLSCIKKIFSVRTKNLILVSASKNENLSREGNSAQHGNLIM